MTETITYAPNVSTKSVSPHAHTIGLPLYVQEVSNEAPLLRIHDQEMIRSSRIMAAQLLCKQRLSQWTVVENTIFLSELNVDTERSAGILSHINRLHSYYMRAMDTPG